MKFSFLIFSFLFQVVFTGFLSRAGNIINTDTVPCYEYGYFNVILPKKPVYLPDSLGGDMLNGKMALVIHFNKLGQPIEFRIKKMVLKNKSLIRFEYLNLENKNNISKCDFDPILRPFYDFISDYVYKKLVFIPNKGLPKYCSLETDLTFLFKIGNFEE